ncbi:MAG: cobalamin cluster protein [Halobacteriales archaeon SW_9_67_25]|nr:MAG: cobalamin cluster protein [Halobacteriales archaeon SW_9_67_25]
MIAESPTVSDRLAQARHELTAREVAVALALAGALGFALLVMQEPLAHDALHNFRHSAGITCH